MIKVKILATGEIQTVTPNVAHDLVERGLAKVFKGQDKQIRPSENNTKGYVIK